MGTLSERDINLRIAFPDEGPYERLQHLAERQPWLVDVARTMVELSASGIPIELAVDQNLFDQPPFSSIITDVASERGFNPDGVRLFLGLMVYRSTHGTYSFEIGPAIVKEYMDKKAYGPDFYTADKIRLIGIDLSLPRIKRIVILKDILDDLLEGLDDYPYWLQYIKISLENTFRSDGRSYVPYVQFPRQTNSRWLPDYAMRVIEYRHLGTTSMTGGLGYKRSS